VRAMTCSSRTFGSKSRAQGPPLLSAAFFGSQNPKHFSISMLTLKQPV
jgi:hypothetical protein